MITSSNPAQVLGDIAGLFGVRLFKEKQNEVIGMFLSRRNTFVSLPMGYSKSIICTTLPLVFDRLLDRNEAL